MFWSDGLRPEEFPADFADARRKEISGNLRDLWEIKNCNDTKR
jgi:hypothetical protein